MNILECAESLGFEVIKAGSNYKAKVNLLRSEKNSSLFFDVMKNRYKDFGSGEGGDMIDLIRKIKGCSFLEAKNFLSSTLKSAPSSPATPKSDLYKKRDLILKNLSPIDNRFYTLLVFHGVEKIILNDERLKKFFEAEVIEVRHNVFEFFIKYLFWDNYYNCLAIKIFNRNRELWKIVRYRPENIEPKYLYWQDNTVADNFVFEKYMEILINKNEYVFIGEGLKNAFNALLYEIPFISFESVAFVKNFDFIKKYSNKELIGAFDGDVAGALAHKKFCQNFVKIENLLEFGSGLDFTDYIKKIRSEYEY